MTETQQPPPIDAATALIALLALAAAQRDDPLLPPDERRRTEVVLAEAGLNLTQIALVTGRKYETVKTTLRRARAGAAAKSGPKAARSTGKAL
jgi:DNA-directed RNA polymerase specialized sigma24 family protein